MKAVQLTSRRILPPEVYSIEIIRESDGKVLITVMDDRVIVHAPADLSVHVARMIPPDDMYRYDPDAPE